VVSLWFTLRINRDEAGSMVIRRLEPEWIDLTDPAHDDVVGTYLVIRDGEELGTVQHRYGDGKWALVRRALEL
jgi:hypothetical protein